MEPSTTAPLFRGEIALPCAQLLAPAKSTRSRAQNSVDVHFWQGSRGQFSLLKKSIFSNNYSFVVAQKNLGKLEIVIFIIEMKGLLSHWITDYLASSWGRVLPFWTTDSHSQSHLSGAIEQAWWYLWGVFMQTQEYRFYLLAKSLRQISQCVNYTGKCETSRDFLETKRINYLVKKFSCILGAVFKPGVMGK